MNYNDISFSEKAKDSNVLGFLMGICLVALAVVIFLKTHHNIYLDNNTTFRADFPIWRGASYFVAFQWILGFALFIL